MTDNNSKFNNSGFTLVELLVALAISGIVIVMISIFIVNSSNIFNNENKNIDLQNEFQVVDGFLSETLMEAKTLNIENNGKGQTITVYTGEKNKDKSLCPVTTEAIEPSSVGETAAAVTTERIITYNPDNTSLYITKSYVENLTKGSLVSGSVKSFSVTIDDSCKTYEEKKDVFGATYLEHKGYANPIILNINLNVSNGEDDKTEVVKITVRNQLTEVVVDGKKYTVK